MNRQNLPYLLANLYKVSIYDQHYRHSVTKASRNPEFVQGVQTVFKGHHKWELVGYVHRPDRSKFRVVIATNGERTLENLVYYKEPYFRRKDDPLKSLLFVDGTDATAPQNYQPTEEVAIYQHEKIICNISLEAVSNNPNWKEDFLNSLRPISNAVRNQNPPPQDPAAKKGVRRMIDLTAGEIIEYQEPVQPEGVDPLSPAPEPAPAPPCTLSSGAPPPALTPDQGMYVRPRQSNSNNRPIPLPQDMRSRTPPMSSSWTLTARWTSQAPPNCRTRRRTRHPCPTAKLRPPPLPVVERMRQMHQVPKAGPSGEMPATDLPER